MAPMHAVLSVVLGSLVGFSLGLVGGGGSILTVPLLVYGIGESVSAAIGTSLAIVGLTALAGFLRQWRRRSVRFKTGLVFGVTGTVGAFLGTWLGHLLPSGETLFLFAVLMAVAAIAMVRRADGGQSLDQDGTCDERYTRRDWVKVLVAGAGVGVLTGFFGVGGGFVIVPVLVLVLGIPMRLAVGTSLLIIAINSLAGLAAHLQYSGINAVTVILFASGGLVGILAGTGVAGRVPEARLQRTFAYGLVAMAIYLVVRSHPALG